MPATRKMTRARAWQLRKKKKGLCQWCGRNPARIVCFLDGRRRRGALCDRCEAKRRNTVTIKLKTGVDLALPKV